MDERYGAENAPYITDIQWIEEATGNGDVLLCKDLRIAKNPLEADAVYRVSARAFGLSRADIGAPLMIDYFLGNQDALFAMAQRAAGPYVVSVRPNDHQRPLARVKLNLPRA